MASSVTGTEYTRISARGCTIGWNELVLLSFPIMNNGELSGTGTVQFTESTVGVY